MKKDEMKGEQSEPGDMQMSENAKCKKCGKGEKLCKCLAMSEKADLCKNCGDLHKSTACMKGKSFKQMKDLEKGSINEQANGKPRFGYEKREGISEMGKKVRSAFGYEESMHGKKEIGAAKTLARNTLADMKNAPKPKLVKADLCKKCGDNHSLEKCTLGKSLNQIKGLEKARVDEGKDLAGKVSARQERNDRDVKSTKTPSGQNTRTAKTSYKRMQELESSSNPAARRPGEKIVGKSKEMAEDKSGVHIRGGTYGKNKNVVGGGPQSIGAMSEKGGNKSYRSGGKYHSGGNMGAKMAHDDVMSANSKIKPMMKSELQPGMSLNDLERAEQALMKAEQALMKAEFEANDLAAEARAALDLVRSKLFPKK